MSMEAKFIHDVMISRYFAAAALVLVMYDATLTIDDEVSGSLAQAIDYLLPSLKVRLVWSGPFTVPKVLYYINRYWTIASLIAANYRE